MNLFNLISTIARKKAKLLRHNRVKNLGKIGNKFYVTHININLFFIVIRIAVVALI